MYLGLFKKTTVKTFFVNITITNPYRTIIIQTKVAHLYTHKSIHINVYVSVYIFTYHNTY